MANEQDIYSQILDNEAPQQESTMRQSMFVASQTTPDQAAQSQTLSKETGLPADVISRNTDKVKQDKTVDGVDYGYLIDNNPGLSKWLESPNNASVSSDDLGPLGAHEKQVKDYSMLESLGRSFVSGAAGTGAAITRIPAFAYDLQYLGTNLALKGMGFGDKQIRSPEWLRNNPAAKWFDAQQQAWNTPDLDKNIIEEIKQGNYGGAGRSMLSQVVANAPQLVGIIAAGPVYGLAAAGTIQGAAANKVAQESGVDPVRATTDAALQGGIEALFEKVGTFGILKKWEGAIAKSVGKQSSKQVMKEFGKTLAYSAFAEGNEELWTQAGQDFSDYITGVNPDALKGVWSRAFNNAIVGAASGVGVASPASVASVRLRMAQVRQAEQAKNFYLAMGQTAEASKLRERLPEAHRQYVESITKDTPVENIYIPVEAWDMFMQSKNVDPSAIAGQVGVSQEYDQAKETGTDIKVPLATWANKIVGTEYYQGMADDIKFDPNGLTPNQAKEQEAQVKAELEKAAEQAQAAADKEIMTPDAKKIVDEQSAAIQAKISEQLKATGKFSDTDIQHLSSLWSNAARVLGGRQGLMPMDFFNQNPLNVKKSDALPDQAAGKSEFNQLPQEATQFAQDSGLVSPIDSSSDVGFINGDNFIQLGQYKTHDQLVSGMGMTNSREAVAKGLVRVHNQYGGGNYEVAAGNESGYDAINQALLAKGENGFKGNIYVDVLGQSGKSTSVDFKVSEFIDKGGDVRAFLPNGGKNLYFQGPDNTKAIIENRPFLKETAERIAKERGLEIDDQGFITLYHGTRSSKKIESSGVLNSGSFFSDNEKTAQQYANAAQQKGKPVVMKVKVDPQALFPGEYWTTNEHLYLENGKWQVKDTLNQGTDPLGAIIFGKEGGFDMRLLKDMNYSTFIHETGHAFLELVRRASTQENVPEDIKDMSANVLKWLDIKSWDQLERKHHEQFAQGFEKYLFEGKAPSEGLRAAFNRFKVWLTSVYKTLQGLKVELSDDIRNVMDRILASDEEIAQARAENGQDQMILDPIKVLGEERGQRYLKAIEETKQESEAAMSLKLMEEYQRERKSWWMDELRKIRQGVAQEVNARPEQIALSVLQRGKMPDGTPVPSEMEGLKINTKDLIQFYANKFDMDVSATDSNLLEAEYNVESLEETLKEIERFRDDAGKIRRYDNDYLKEELDKIPRRYITSNKFAKTLDEAASDLGFESDMALADKMIENEIAYKDISQDLIQARKELRSVKKQNKTDKYASIKEAMRALPRRISNKDGISVDVVAQMFGYSSPEQFLDVMSRVRPRNELIKEISRNMMVDQYGEVYGDKQAMNEQAQEAIRNDKKEQVLRMELDYLAETHKPVLKDMIRTLSARIPSIASIKKSAAEIVGRTTLSNLSPYQFQLAERRAAKSAGQAFTQGKFDEAFEWKRKELLNYELSRAATEARNDIKKSIENFKKIAKSDEKVSKSRDADYVNAARSILALHGIGEASEDPYQYLKNTQSYDPDTYQTLLALVEAATETPGDYKNQTYDQFVNMKQAVDAIWEIAKRSRQIQIEGKKVELEEVLTHLIDRMVELNKDKKSGYSKSASENEKFSRALMGAIAQGKRVEYWTDLMDGGDQKGWFTQAIWNPVVEGTQEFRLRNREFTQKFLDLIKPMEKEFKKREIVSDELLHIFQSKAELLGALLHTGNESNLSKLLRGRGWGMLREDGSLDTSRWDAFIKRMTDSGVLTKQDYDFVQSIWDLFEEMKPGAQKAHKEMYGYYFNTITADEFTTPWGKYRGGYAPAIVDPFVSEDAAIRQEKEAAETTNNSYMFPTTGRGFSKARVEGYAAPLALDLRLVPQHINKVLRFTYIEPRVKDVGRIIRNQNFREYLRDLDPVAGQHMLSPWLQRAAQQIVEQPDKSWAGWRVWREIRSRSGINIMAANVVNTLQQFTGLSIAAVKVKPKYLRNSLWNFMQHPKIVSNTVYENSDFMKTRSTTQIMEIQNTIDDLILNQGKYGKAIDFAKRHAYFMQQGTQNVVDMVVWPAAYDQSVAEGNSHDQAVRDADAAVRKTQGDFSPENVSNLESGNAFARAFLMFYSYFNMQANLLGTEFAKVSRDLGLKRGAGKAFYIYMMGFMIPAVVSELIMRGLSGADWDKDDDGYLDDVLDIFFGSQFRTATAMFPFVGQIANAAVNKWNKKWYDDDIRSSPAISMIESASHAPYSVYKAIADDGNKKSAIRDLLSLLGLLTGAPLQPLSKPAGYLSDVSDGNVYPENNIDFTRGLITGKSGK